MVYNCDVVHWKCSLSSRIEERDKLREASTALKAYSAHATEAKEVAKQVGIIGDYQALLGQLHKTFASIIALFANCNLPRSRSLSALILS